LKPAGLRAYFDAHPEIRVAIFAGKGGLGKTTSSSSLAYYMATEKKRKTLLFSTDPQASLSDIFEQNFFGRGVIEVIPNLYVVEIDADRRVAEYQASVKQKIREMYGLEELPREIEEYIDSSSAEPSMYESATYDAMAELVAAGEYDMYIFDMPPFGHGVRMVAMAEILSKWVEKITEARSQVAEYEQVAASLKGERAQEDAMMAELVDIRRRITTFTDLITNQTSTGFFMVLIPEQMAILDTDRALSMFSELGIQLSGLIVNQVYPPELIEQPNLSEFLRNRLEGQRPYLQEIAHKFGDHVLSVVPMYTREPKGLEMIAQASADLMDCKVAI
jgi:arsenite-transporting ATPase